MVDTAVERRTINGSSPVSARRPAGRRGRSESRANRKRRFVAVAVCDSLDSHSCHRAKRGAASGQECVEVTDTVFSWLFVFFVTFVIFVTLVRRRVVVSWQRQFQQPAQRS